MKQNLIALAIFCMSSTSLAIIMGKEGGGGIVLAAEFATAGREAIKILALGDGSLNPRSILDTIKNTKVIPVDEICFTEPVLNKRFCEDAHYDAKNNTILFAYKKWDDISSDEKMLLSSHELLRAAGLETEDYQYSGRFITGKIAQCGEGFAKAQLQCADLAGLIDSRIAQLSHQLTTQMVRRDQSAGGLSEK